MKRILSVLFSAAVILSLTATPAFADAFDSTGGTGSSGTGTTVHVEIRCIPSTGVGNLFDNGVDTGDVVYTYPFPPCYGGGNSLTLATNLFGTESRRICDVGWEVWRFYGTIANPRGYMSVSRINGNDTTGPDGGCLPNAAPVLLFAPHPNDAGVAPGHGQQNAAGADIWGRPSYVAATNRGTMLTSATPFRHLGTGDCRTYANSVDNLTGLLEANNIAAALSNSKAGYTTEFGAPIATAMVNNLEADDGIPCNSGFEYFGFTEANQRVVGTCYIPIRRRYVLLINYDDPPQIAYADPAWQEKGGERYDDTRYGLHAGTLGNLGTSVEANVRDWIHDEVASRPGTILWPQKSGGLVVPGEPYPADWQNMVNPGSANRELAAQAAANHSECMINPMINGTIPPPEADPEGFVDVTLSAPSKFLTGGATLRQNVTATPGPFTCNNCVSPAFPPLYPKGPNPIFGNLNITINVAATGGYEAYKLVSNGSGSGGLTPRVSTLEFYAGAANTSQKITASASGTGRFVAFPKPEMVSINLGVDVNGNPLPPVQVPYWNPVTYPITVRVNPGSLTRDIIGATAAPRNG